MTDKQWELVDDLLSDFNGDEGPYFIGPETQDALMALYAVACIRKDVAGMAEAEPQISGQE